MQFFVVRIFSFSLVVFAFALGVVAQNCGRWERVTPLPQEYNLLSVEVIPESRTLIATGEASTLIMSDDQGLTWEVIRNPAGMNFSFTGNGTFFLDQYTGFLYGGFSAILKTGDGGYSWNTVFQGSSDARDVILTLEFADSQHGYAIAQQGFQCFLLETFDAGVLWEAVGPVAGSSFSDIAFANSQTGIILADTNTVFSTMDGGNTWNAMHLPDAVSFLGSQSGVTFLNDSTAFITCMSRQQAAIFRSEDYGATWDCVFQDWRYPMKHEVLFFNSMEGICVLPTSYGYNVTVFSTSDGGLHWTEVTPSNSVSWLEGQSFVVLDNQKVIAVGERGAIHLSDNRGVHWVPLFTRMVRGNSINSWFFDPGVCLLHTDSDGDGGVAAYGLYQSVDSARTWTKTGSFWQMEVCMDFLSPDTAFMLATDMDKVLSRTTDGGASWEEFFMGFGGQYEHHALIFYDFFNGLILCNGHILKTTDAGETWVDVNAGNSLSVDFQSAAYCTAQRIFATGNNAGSPSAVWRSDDGGDSWNPVTSITGESYRTVYFFDDNMGFIAGNNAIVKTVDGGDTWYQVDLNVSGSMAIEQVHFPTSATGYAVGDGIKVVKTTDGGATWFPLEIGLTSGLTAVHFYNENSGIVAGQNGVVFITHTGGETFIETYPAAPVAPCVISVYPNPAVGYLTLVFTEPEQAGEVQLIHPNGVEVMRFTHKCYVNSMIINISGFPSGTYLVRYCNGSSDAVQKVMIR